MTGGRRTPKPDEIPTYDEVPPRFVSTSDNPALDMPTYAWSPGRQRAVLAMNSRDRDAIVNLRCEAQAGRRQCRKLLGGVWSTRYGVVLVVDALTDTSLLLAYKENLRPGPEADHLSESSFIDEHPILLTDVSAAMVWCPEHGTWPVDLTELRSRVARWKKTGRNQTMATSPPSPWSTLRERSARTV